MRPESIRRFDLFYLGSIAISILVMAFGYDATLEQARSVTVGSGLEPGPGLVIGSFVFGLLISLLLWYLVSRKGFAVAKWIIILLFLYGIFGVPGAFANGLSTLETLSLVGVALQAVSIWYLFQPDAKAWFAGERGEADEALD